MYWCQIISYVRLLRIVENLCKETLHSLLIIHDVKYYFILHALYSTKFISQLSEYAHPSVTIFPP